MDEIKRDDIQKELLEAVQQAESGNTGAPVTPNQTPDPQTGYTPNYQANFRPQAQPGYGQMPYQGQAYQNQSQPYGQTPTSTPYNGQSTYNQQTSYNQPPTYGQQAPYNPQTPYNQTNYNPYTGMRHTTPMPGSGAGIASLICGIASLLTCLFPFIGFALGLAGIITGIVAKKQQGSFGGIALAGFICGICGLAINTLIYGLAIIAVFLEDYYWYY